MNRVMTPFVRQPESVDDYDHAEAFMKMLYQCENEKCRNIEVLWNSRDGVTPFTIHCTLCSANDIGSAMSHIVWELDARLEQFTPPVGMRIFVDLTPELNREGYKKMVEREWNGKYPMSERWATKEEALEALVKNFDVGSPHVLTVDEKYLKEK